MEQNFENGNNRKTVNQKAIREFIILLLIFALVAALAFYLGRTFFESWPIIGTSMEPNIHNDDRVIVVKTNKIDYDDIIIFNTNIETKDKVDDKYLIKRVIGKPGDKIEIKYSETDFAWHVYRNGEIVSEKHILEGIVNYSEMTIESIPEGKYFVLGDNRNNSHDSHIAGFYAEEDEIVGKALVRYKSPIDFSFLIK